jgi:hypothetical protein
MGVLTRTELVTAALLKAGNTNLTTNAVTWLNAWLRSQYRGFPWPFLRRNASLLTLSSGATIKTVGNGNGGVAKAIQYLTGHVFIFTSDRATRARAYVRQVEDGDAFSHEDGLLSTDTGLPTLFRVRQSTVAETYGTWDLFPYPLPDKAYLLSFEYLMQPDNLAADATVPLYPNDRTMIQAIMCDALQYMDRRREYQMELGILGSMVNDDRMKYGQVPGTNDVLPLDPSTFR